MASSTAPRPPRPTIPSRFLLSRLQEEWRRLATDPSCVAAARRWALGIAAIQSLDDVLVATGLTPPGAGVPSVITGDAAAADDLLHRIVVLARDDQLAARLVLQRILPGLSCIARQRSKCLTEQIDVVDELLAAAWEAIRSFRHETRRHDTAAKLIRDAEYIAFRRGTRRLLRHELVETNALDQPVDGVPEPEPLLELVELLASLPGHQLESRDLELIAHLVNHRTAIDVARDLKVSERTVRNRRDAMVGRLRAVLAA